MTIFEKLVSIQSELKAPKSQFNKFGNYHYRNQEDILEAVKPLLKKYQAVLTISDQIVVVEGRHYVEATAKLTDIESGSVVSTSAFAREDADKKGMDLSQLTGATSSYARKYALNGLFLIDDTKDADATNTHTSNVAPTAPKIAPQPVVTPKVEVTPQAPVSAFGEEINKHMEDYKTFDGNLPQASNKCVHCNDPVNERVINFSTKTYGKIICYPCQQKGLK